MMQRKILHLLLFLLIVLAESCYTTKKVGTETETVTKITPKQIDVKLTDSLHIAGEQLHIAGITVHVDSTGLPVLEKQTIKQGRSTATVSVVAGKLQLDVQTPDSNLVFTRTVPVHYNDSNTKVTTTITKVETKTAIGKILSGLCSIPVVLVIITAVALCYTLFKRSR